MGIVGWHSRLATDAWDPLVTISGAGNSGGDATTQAGNGGEFRFRFELECSRLWFYGICSKCTTDMRDKNADNLLWNKINSPARFQFALCLYCNTKWIYAYTLKVLMLHVRI